MSTRTMSLVAARPRLRMLGLSIAGLLVCAVLLGSVFAGGAQAARAYNSQEIAFVNSLNQYRAANGLQPLQISDAISEACYRHNSDMAKYKFFSHYTVKSDWFAVNATPWDRMAKSGYSYSTSKGENIAAGQSTAALAMEAWKNSAGHNANMLNSAYKVIGISFHQLAGSPYTYYWTTDFGGYVDPTAHSVGSAPSTPPPSPPPAQSPGTTRIQQTDSRIAYSGTWYTFSTSGASSGSYKRAKTNGASCTVTFNGTYLAWIATKGTTMGKAYVSVDGKAAQLVDLARTSVAYQQSVWNTGTLAEGQHRVKIWWYPSNITGKYISVDAFDVKGSLATATAVADTKTIRYEQTDSRVRCSGTWETFSAAGSSAGSYKRTNLGSSAVTLTFTGTSLTWVATVGTTLGKAYVSLDGGPAKIVDLSRSATGRQIQVWSTGPLASGQHTVKIWRDPNNAAGKYISIDAFDVTGTLN